MTQTPRAWTLRQASKVQAKYRGSVCHTGQGTLLSHSRTDWKPDPLPGPAYFLSSGTTRPNRASLVYANSNQGRQRQTSGQRKRAFLEGQQGVEKPARGKSSGTLGKTTGFQESSTGQG